MLFVSDVLFSLASECLCVLNVTAVGSNILTFRWTLNWIIFHFRSYYATTESFSKDGSHFSRPWWKRALLNNLFASKIHVRVYNARNINFDLRHLSANYDSFSTVEVYGNSQANVVLQKTLYTSIYTYFTKMHNSYLF